MTRLMRRWVSSRSSWTTGCSARSGGIYNQVLRNKPSDIGLTAVASNNLIAVNKDQNIFDSKKWIKATV